MSKLIKATAAPSPHVEGAQALIEKIRAMRNDIPRFTVDGLADGRSQTAGLVPDRFIESASSALGNHAVLTRQERPDGPSMRDAYAYAMAYDPVVQELKALTQFLEHSIRVQRNAAGVGALDVYADVKRLARRPDGAELKPVAEDMRQKLGKTGRPRKATSDPVKPAPVPVPPAPPAAPDKPKS